MVTISVITPVTGTPSEASEYYFLISGGIIIYISVITQRLNLLLALGLSNYVLCPIISVKVPHCCITIKCKTYIFHDSMYSFWEFLTQLSFVGVQSI